MGENEIRNLKIINHDLIKDSILNSNGNKGALCRNNISYDSISSDNNNNHTHNDFKHSENDENGNVFE